MYLLCSGQSSVDMRHMGPNKYGGKDQVLDIVYSLNVQVDYGRLHHGWDLRLIHMDGPD